MGCQTIGTPANPPGSAAPPAVCSTIAAVTTGFNGSGNILYVLDRERGGWFSSWTYPTATNLGASIPFQSCMVALGDNVVMSGGDGNLYLQPTRILNLTQSVGEFDSTYPSFTPDDGGTPVTSAVRSDRLWLGSGNLQKQIRRYLVSGICSSGTATLTHYVYDSLGNLKTFTAASGATLPFQTDQPSLDTSGMVSDCVASQVEFVAQNCQLQSIDYMYRIVRIAAGRLP